MGKYVNEKVILDNKKREEDEATIAQQKHEMDLLKVKVSEQQQLIDTMLGVPK